jgi:hypothetical protein
MTPTTRAALIRRGAIVLLTLSASVEAGAEPVPYDPNCNPVELTEDQTFEQEICGSHAGCRFLVMAPIRAGCKAVNFIRNIGKSDPRFDNSTLIDGMTYDVPRQTKFDEFMFNVKANIHEALGTAAKRDVVQTDDGRVAYYEGGHLSNGSGTGAMIYSDGTMARGTFDSKYKLNGAGQLITPDGKMRAGEFNNNQLSGPGFIAEQDGKRTVLIEGTFDGDTPVGEVVRNYADGSRVRELWENGKMVARGDPAPKGKVPPPIRKPETRLASAEVKHGLYQVEGPNGTKRWELWCKDRLADKGLWYPKGHYPQKPERQTCEKQAEQDYAGEPDVNSGDLVQRTLGPAKMKPAGRVINPLVVQGPPWPCSNEMNLHMQAWVRRAGGGYKSPDAYWREFGFSPIRVLFNSNAATRKLIGLHNEYMATAANVQLQPVVFTYNGYEFREGFFRNARSMQSLSKSLESDSSYEAPGGEAAASLMMNACIARYLAENAAG